MIFSNCLISFLFSAIGDVMADLNLFNAMLKCRDFVQADDDEERIHIEFDDQPVEQYPPHVFGTKQKLESPSSDYPSFDKASAKNDLGGSIASLEPDKNLMLVVSPSKKDYDVDDDGDFDYQPSRALQREPAPYGTAQTIKSLSLEPDNSLMLHDEDYQPSKTLEREPAPYARAACAEPQIPGELVMYGDSSAPIKNPTKHRESQPYSHALQKEEPLPTKRGPSKDTKKGTVEREPAPYSSAQSSSLKREPAPYSSGPSSDESSDRVHWNPNVYYGNQPAKKKAPQKQAARPSTKAPAPRKNAQRPAKSPAKTTTRDENKHNAKAPPKVQTVCSDDSSEASESSTAVSVDEVVPRKVPDHTAQPKLKPAAQDNKNRKSPKREPEATSDSPVVHSNNAPTAEKLSKQEEDRGIPSEPNDGPRHRGVRKLFGRREPKEPTAETPANGESRPAARATDNKTPETQRMKSNNNEAPEENEEEQDEESKPEAERRGIRKLLGRREPREQHSKPTEKEPESKGPGVEEDKDSHQCKDSNNGKQQRSNRNLLERKERVKLPQEEQEKEESKVEVRETANDVGSGEDESGRNRDKNHSNPKGLLGFFKRESKKNPSEEVRPNRNEPTVDNDPSTVHNAGEELDPIEEAKTDQKTQTRRGLFKREPKANSAEEEHAKSEVAEVSADDADASDDSRSAIEHEGTNDPARRKGLRNLFKRENKQSNKTSPDKNDSEVESSDDEESNEDEIPDHQPVKRRRKWTLTSLFRRKKRDSSPTDGPGGEDDSASESESEENVSEEAAAAADPVEVSRRNYRSPMTNRYQPNNGAGKADGELVADESSIASDSTTVADDVIEASVKETRQSEELPCKAKTEGNEKANKQPSPEKTKPAAVDQAPPPSSKSEKVRPKPMKEDMSSSRRERTDGDSKANAKKEKSKNQTTTAKSNSTDPLPPPSIKKEKVKPKPERKEVSSPRTPESKRAVGENPKPDPKKEKPKKQATISSSTSENPESAARINTKPRSDDLSSKIGPESRGMPVDDAKVSENDDGAMPLEQLAAPPKKQSSKKIKPKSNQEPGNPNHHTKENEAASESPDACFDLEEIKKIVEEYEQHTDRSSLQPSTDEVHNETKQKHKEGKAHRPEESACDSSIAKQKQKQKEPEKAGRRHKTEKPGSKGNVSESAEKPIGAGLSTELVPLPPNELVSVPPIDSSKNSFTMDREPAPYNMGPIGYEEHADEPSGEGMPNKLLPVPPIESSRSTFIRDREPAPYNMSAIGDQDEEKVNVPTRDGMSNVLAIDSAQSPYTMDREPAPYNMSPITESLATGETRTQSERSPAIGSGHAPPAKEKEEDTREDDPQLAPPVVKIESDAKAKKVHRTPMAEDPPAKSIEKKQSKKKVDKPKEEPRSLPQSPGKIEESAPKVSEPPKEEKTESTDGSARKPIEKKKSKKQVDKPKEESRPPPQSSEKKEESFPKISDILEKEKKTPRANALPKKKKSNRTTNEPVPTQPVKTTMEKDRSLKPPASPKHHSNKKKISGAVEAAKEASESKPVPPPKPVVTVEEHPQAAPTPAAPPEAPAARPRRRRDEARTKEVNIEMRMKCYMWYARMGQPNRDTMKRRVAKLKDCDITVEDVDELPWICGGAMLSVREMNNLISNNKAYEVPAADPKA